MSDNTNQRKTITGASAAYRYAHIAGISSFIVFIPIFFFIGFMFWLGFLGMDSSTQTVSSADISRIAFLISLPIHIVCSLIALLVTAPIIRERYNFRYDPWALLQGCVHYLAWILIPALLFRDLDASPYHLVSTGAYLLLITLYYCIGFYAFHRKKDVEVVATRDNDSKIVILPIIIVLIVIAANVYFQTIENSRRIGSVGSVGNTINKPIITYPFSYSTVDIPIIAGRAAANDLIWAYINYPENKCISINSYANGGASVVNKEGYFKFALAEPCSKEMTVMVSTANPKVKETGECRSPENISNTITFTYAGKLPAVCSQ